jgi:chemotaxis-related protein WspB
MLLLTFNVGVNRYAVDSIRVVELIPRVDLRSIPHAPSLLAGLLAYRGKVVPVIDLGLLLADAPCRQSLSTRIILVADAPGDENRRNDNRDGSVKNGGPGPWDPTRDPNLLGLVAERVSDLTSVKPEQIGPTPVQISEAPYLDAIVQTDQGIVQLIAVDRIRDAVLRGVLPGPDETSPPECSVQQATESKFNDRESENS